MITRNMDYSAITLMGTSPEVILSEVEYNRIPHSSDDKCRAILQ